MIYELLSNEQLNVLIRIGTGWSKRPRFISVPLTDSWFIKLTMINKASRNAAKMQGCFYKKAYLLQLACDTNIKTELHCYLHHS